MGEDRLRAVDGPIRGGAFTNPSSRLTTHRHEWSESDEHQRRDLVDTPHSVQLILPSVSTLTLDQAARRVA